MHLKQHGLGSCSRAWFTARVAELGLEGIAVWFRARGWETAASFAFAAAVVLGQGDAATSTGLFNVDVVEPFTGDRTSVQRVALGREYFEFHHERCRR